MSAPVNSGSSAGDAVREGADPAADEWTIYTPESALREPGRLLRSMAGDIWAGRGLAWRMFVRNIKGLYRQTLLGLFWAFLPPLAHTAIWAFLYHQRVITFGDRIEANYVAYVLAGMVLWQAFADAFMAPLNAVQSNRNILGKLRFPREAVLVVSIYEVVFDLSVRSAVLVPVLLLLGADVSGWLALAPCAALALIGVGLGMGLWLMPAGVLYQDVGRFLAVIMPVWMILTQIVYPPPPDWVHSPLNWCNPASPLLLWTRDILVLGESAHGTAALLYAGAGIVLVATGFVVYRLSVPILMERTAL